MKLVYIGGYGHSGSTLLEYLMTGCKQVIACGEVINARLKRASAKTCSCRPTDRPAPRVKLHIRP